MIFKRYYLLFSLLLTGILLFTTGYAQTGATDSVTIVTPPLPDSSYEMEDEEYDEEYTEREAYEDSIQRAETNAFDTLNVHATTVSQRRLPGSFTADLKKDPSFSYVKNGIPVPEKRDRPQMGLSIDDIWIYVAVILLLVLLAWYLKANDLLFFRKKPAIVPSASSNEELKDIFSVNYDIAIKEALDNKNYRLAIRLHYLQLLKILSEKQMIHYQPDTTNFDYLQQLSNTPHYKDFSGLTRQYEYSWYGLFPINEQQYERIDALFTNFHKNISG